VVLIGGIISLYYSKINGIAIVGCGLIGRKRADAIADHRLLIGCYDISNDSSQLFSKKYNIISYNSINDLLSDSNVNLVIIATTHNSLASLSLECLKANKHVFVEKPAAINYRELDELLKFKKNTNCKIHVGFNHRHHRALLKAQEIVHSGKIGDLMFIRGRYGHGGRIGYEKEWRSNEILSGGGELIDQGSHLIDLAGLFLGKFHLVRGFADTFYWDMNVDDNAFLTLRTKNGQTAFLHASSSEWKNIFSFEIYGRTGKIDINGLGGSYGIEKITHYEMLPEMGPPNTYSWEYPFPDNSWKVELEYFFNCIEKNIDSSSSLENAYEVLKIISKIYEGVTS